MTKLILLDCENVLIDSNLKIKQVLEGAIEATKKLKKHGYKIIVLANADEKEQDKKHNELIGMGLAIDATIACGTDETKNLKNKFIDILKPDYFVSNINSKTNKSNITKHIMIDRYSNNKNQSLKDFVDKTLIY